MNVNLAYERCIELDPLDGLMRPYDLKFDIYLRCIELDPLDGRAFLGLSRILDARGESAAAVSAIERCRGERATS